MKFPEYHAEVLRALQALRHPSLGTHMAKDRGSSLKYLGIRVPALRRRVRQGFSFYDLEPASVLAVWDDLWMGSEWGDVLFAAEEYYRPIVRKRVDAAYWPVMKHWIGRVDNWAHSDVLSWTYSRLLEAGPETVMPVLRQWNRGEALWPKRVSIVSLIHYTGRNAAFLTPDEVLPMVDRCAEDRRQPMQKAVGWVLREMWHAYPEEIERYLAANAGRIAPSAFTRAIERMGVEERRKMRERQRAAGAAETGAERRTEGGESIPACESNRSATTTTSPCSASEPTPSRPRAGRWGWPMWRSRSATRLRI